MALKPVVTRDEYDKLPDPIRGEYAEKDGKFQVVIEGAIPGFVPESDYRETKSRLNEFRDISIRHRDRIEKELEPKLRQFEEEKEALRAEKEALAKKGVTAPEDVSVLIAKAVKPLQETIFKQEQERARLTEEVITREFDKRLADIALEKGIDPTFLPDIIERAHKVFKYADGKIAARNAEGGLVYDNRGEPLSAEAWVPEIPKPFYRQSSGGGALPGGSTPKSTAKQLVNPTPEQMGQHLDAIIKGEMVVVRH